MLVGLSFISIKIINNKLIIGKGGSKEHVRKIVGGVSDHVRLLRSPHLILKDWVGF